MTNIDFSKAPEGATHFRCYSGDVHWYKRGVDGWVYTWGSCAAWATDDEYCYPTLREIPQPIGDCKAHNPLLIECNNEREVMLCKQVLRMCRGEGSEFKSGLDGEWKHKSGNTVNVNVNYRAKPKKELVVPWEWVPDAVASIEVKSNGRILGHSKNESSLAIEFTTTLKLDLTNIELPVTAHRPQ